MNNHADAGVTGNPAVLVPEAHAVGMLGVIRSLGRVGYRVHACAFTTDAIGFRSRFVANRAVCPPYDADEFVPWLREYVAENSIVAIISSETLLCALREDFEEFAPLIPVSPDRDVVFGTIGKFSVFQRLLSSPTSAKHMPPLLMLGPEDCAPSVEEVAGLGLPVFIKADAIHSLHADADEVHRVDSADEAVERIRALRNRYSHLSVQGFVPGRGAGVYLLRWGHETLMEFMNTCEHEVPHSGGFCSLRTSFRNQEMLADAKAKLDQLGWQGVAMLEYRWDEKGQCFWLVEVNARFWAALHLALFAGVDFPRRLMEAHFGHLVSSNHEYCEGVRARLTAPFEIAYVGSRLRDRTIPFRRRAWTVVEFFLLFLDPRVHADLLFPGDRRLYWVQWWRIARRWFSAGLTSGRRWLIGARASDGKSKDTI